MTRQEIEQEIEQDIEQKMDALAREYYDTHDPED